MNNSLDNSGKVQLINRMRQNSTQLSQRTIQTPFLTKSTHPHLGLRDFPSSNFMVTENKNNSDVRSLIQQLMRSKDINYAKLNIPRPTQPILLKTEQKIFQEVVNLLIETQGIKNEINQERQETIKLQAERNHLRRQKNMEIDKESIINRLKGKDYEQLRFSVAELQKLTNQNYYLEQQINKMKDAPNFQEKLQFQKQRYEDLKQKLQEKKQQLEQEFYDQELNQEIEELKYQIQRLNRKDIDIDEEIRKLNEDNEELRQQTISLLRRQQLTEDFTEKQRLLEYIRKEQDNKILFFEDLKRFKEQFDELKRENQLLKERARSRLSSADNYFLGTESKARNPSKLDQYENVFEKMKQVLK